MGNRPGWKQPLSQKEVDRILYLSSQGVTPHCIAERMNVTPPTIYRLLNENRKVSGNPRTGREIRRPARS